MSERTAMRIGLVLGLAGWIVAAVLLWRTSVPSLELGGLDVHRYFSPHVLARAHDYGNGERVLWLFGTIASLATLAILVWRPPRSCSAWSPSPRCGSCSCRSRSRGSGGSTTTGSGRSTRGAGSPRNGRC